ncbi:hypothetical protein LY78DRAFT_686467 [Colletotrichum sublineola]|nr:hypothetical protein LY78DRAFT_686467 [Colletotrichum sublineola]
MSHVTRHAVRAWINSYAGAGKPLTGRCWERGQVSIHGIHANIQVPNQKATCFKPIMESSLHDGLAKNKKLQKAATPAFPNLRQRLGNIIEPCCIQIQQQLVNQLLSNTSPPIYPG